MAPITDLSWNQVNEGLKARLGIAEDLVGFDEAGTPTSINIVDIVDEFPEIVANGNSELAGVIKFMAVLFDVCREAQATVNNGQVVGERLNAFITPTTATPVGTLIPVTRSMVSRADLTSVTKVVGANI